MRSIKSRDHISVFSEDLGYTVIVAPVYKDGEYQLDFYRFEIYELDKEDEVEMHGFFKASGCSEVYSHSHFPHPTNLINLISAYRSIPHIIKDKWGATIEGWIDE